LIDIIVPIFDGVAETRQCLDSLLRGSSRKRTDD
jgi:hypothetical protein